MIDIIRFAEIQCQTRYWPTEFAKILLTAVTFLNVSFIYEISCCGFWHYVSCPQGMAVSTLEWAEKDIFPILHTNRTSAVQDHQLREARLRSCSRKSELSRYLEFGDKELNQCTTFFVWSFLESKLIMFPLTSLSSE